MHGKVAQQWLTWQSACHMDLVPPPAAKDSGPTCCPLLLAPPLSSRPDLPVYTCLYSQWLCSLYLPFILSFFFFFWTGQISGKGVCATGCDVQMWNLLLSRCRSIPFLKDLMKASTVLFVLILCGLMLSRKQNMNADNTTRRLVPSLISKSPNGCIDFYKTYISVSMDCKTKLDDINM